MLVIGTYEKNVLLRFTDDNSGEVVTQLLLNPETAIMVSDRILDSVKQLNSALVKTKSKPESKPAKKVSKKTNKKSVGNK